MVSLCSAYQDASSDIHFDLKVTLRSRDLMSTSDLDLEHNIHIPMRFNERIAKVLLFLG